MASLFRGLLACLLLAFAAPALAQSGAGTDPLALVQQFDQNGQPLAGCQLYFYVAGTVATPQQEYSDYGLTQPLPNPLSCDQTGRIPMHWLAAGLIHIRLTDANGTVYVDTTMQVLGPSSGGGGGGGGSGVDPTTIFATGDEKIRFTSETLTGWVILNGQTIGSATSGASQRANADTQNLFVYLWQNCASPSSNNHCTVVGGLGSSALSDFNANKQIMLPDMRDRDVVGRDCMGNICAGGILSTNIASGHGDGPDTAAAWGGLANQTASTTIAQANLPNVNFNVSGISLTNGTVAATANISVTSPGSPGTSILLSHANTINNFDMVNGGPNLQITTNVSVNNSGGVQGVAASGGSGNPATSSNFAVMNPFMLVTFYMKL